MAADHDIESTLSGGAHAHAHAQHVVQIKLFTRHPDIAVSTTGPLLVPVSLRRYGLSQIVNHLLSTDTNTDTDTNRPVPFDFLIDGTFLRTSLDEYLTQNGLSSESTITLEYVRSVLPPVHLASFQQDDWVSSVAIASLPLPFSDSSADEKNSALPPPPPPQSQARILSGSYDGISRIWDQSGNVVAEATGHTGPVKSVAWISQARFLTGSMDRTVRMWLYQETQDDDLTSSLPPPTPSVILGAEYVGHTSTVEKISFNALTSHFLTASADGTVRLWSTSLPDCPAAPTQNITIHKSKRRKGLSTTNASQYGSLSTLHQHSLPISSTIFDPKDSTVAYSTSWDHTIRTYDLTTSLLVDTRTTQHPLLSIAPLPSLSLLACGSSARHITLHDPRASASVISTATLRGHTNAVVGLAASEESEFLLASASHDGTVRVWDVRASGSGKSVSEGGGGTSLYTIKRESGESGKKVFDVKWSKELGIVSCGEDKRIQINSGVNVNDGVLAQGK